MVLEIGGGLFGQRDVRETDSVDLQFHITQFCNVKRTTTQTITAGAFGDIEFNSEISDDDNIHSNSVEPEKITVNKAGIYMIIVELSMDEDPNSQAFKVTKNSTVLYETEVGVTETATWGVILIDELAANDFVFCSINPGTNDAAIRNHSRFTVMKIK